MSPLAFTGACSHTTYRLPALSMAMVGKLPPVLNPGKLATCRSSQFRPDGSLTFATGGPNATVKHRPHGDLAEGRVVVHHVDVPAGRGKGRRLVRDRIELAGLRGDGA